MNSFSFFVVLLLLLVGVTNFLLLEAAETHYYDFVVQQTPVRRMCDDRNIITVNGMYPGPFIKVRNGDSLVISVVNRAQYNVTIHWHGVRQLLTAWSDGPEFVTQCPIRPGESYTYRFKITDQEGTLWWHAHSSWLRATVYGAIAIYPREGTTYPFNKPDRDFPVILGEWWNANPIDVVNEAIRTGAAPNISDAFTINGQPGDLYSCSRKHTETFRVRYGENILLRVVNAALNQELYFSIGNHMMTVVGVDASYTKPFLTNLLMLGPGQTTDVLITADQLPGKYYVAARAFASAPNVSFDNTTTTAILKYTKYGCSSKASASASQPLIPALPAFNDSLPGKAFASRLRSPGVVQVPQPVDMNLLFTVGLGLFNCKPGQNCGGPNNTRLTASVNNISYVSPTNYSILQANFLGLPDVFNPNLPPVPPLKFNFTSANIPRKFWQPMPGTEVLRVKYGSVVQLVFQDTSILAPENHPMHLHGYDFYILATGSGNFNETTDTAKFNLIDPPRRNTVAVPGGGWSVIRFLANNPGAWFMHCHLDIHLTWGLAMVFVVDNGVGELQTLKPPPPDLPMC